MLQNLLRVEREIEDMDVAEARRLLAEAMHVIIRQQESRRQAKLAAEMAVAAADTLIMPR